MQSYIRYLAGYQIYYSANLISISAYPLSSWYWVKYPVFGQSSGIWPDIRYPAVFRYVFILQIARLHGVGYYNFLSYIQLESICSTLKLYPQNFIIKHKIKYPPTIALSVLVDCSLFPQPRVFFPSRVTTAFQTVQGIFI